MVTWGKRGCCLPLSEWVHILEQVDEVGWLEVRVLYELGFISG